MHSVKLLILFIVLGFLTAGKSGAQDAPVQQPPPPIVFNPVNLTADGPVKFWMPSAYASGYPENQNVPLHVLVPEGPGPHPTVIILHYWGAVDLKAEMELAKRLTGRGIASVIVELPYHLTRAPKGTRSGELAIQPDPERMRATMIQAVYDLRRTLDWIETRPEFDGDKIGLAGTSLGAIVGSLAFAIDPRISAYSSILGGADLASTVWGSSRLVREREVLRKNGWTRETLADALRPIEPTAYFKADDPRPAYLIAARYDTIVPVSSYRALQNALPNLKTLWIETGHYGGFVVQNSIHNSVVNFFDKSFSGQTFNAPGRLYAPTLRLAAPASLESGLQVGLGLDFWKSDEQGTAFGTLLLTPKGPQVFIGAKVGGGLAVGASIQTKRTTLGMMWSFVL